MELGYVIGFAFCLMILLLIMLFSMIKWFIKAGIIIASLVIVFSFYVSLVASLGYPVADRPKGIMLIDWMDIRSPTADTPGMIYIWYVDVAEANRTHKPVPPRAIRLPYDKDMHAKLQSAQDKLAKGMPVYMQFDGDGKNKSTNGNGSEPTGNDSGEVTAGGDKGGVSKGGLNFVPPPNTVPTKTHQE